MKRRQQTPSAANAEVGPLAMRAVSLWMSARERLRPTGPLRVAMFSSGCGTGHDRSNDEFKRRLAENPEKVIGQIRAAFKRDGREDFLDRQLKRAASTVEVDRWNRISDSVNTDPDA